MLSVIVDYWIESIKSLVKKLLPGKKSIDLTRDNRDNSIIK